MITRIYSINQIRTINGDIFMFIISITNSFPLINMLTYFNQYYFKTIFDIC
ncbi:hypothetical protein GLOIN_2v1541675, partial [Rhizophagus irregularis DAOM 181602=DAOM 197198]